MSALICGSLAYDTIMVFRDRFKNHILPDKIHILNISFLVPSMRREFGGCAGNIAYNLKLLGGEPLPMGTAGSDFRPYADWLDRSTYAEPPEALARVSPVGIWGTWRDASEVAAAARADAQLTQRHPVCQDASAVFAVTIAAAIRQGLDPQQTYAYALAFTKSAGIAPGVRQALESASGRPPDVLSQQGRGLLALHNAFFELLDAKDVEEAVVRTVRRGGDTATTAAVCGALLGAVYGRDALPADWRRMVLSCRPMPGQPGVKHPRPAQYWPVDALLLAEHLLDRGEQTD